MALVRNKPTALIVHGWRDDPHIGWLGWIAEQLEVRGYKVLAPRMDSGAKPLLKSWQETLIDLAKDLDDQSIIIAHSLGCFLTLRALEEIDSIRLKQVLLVSGFYDSPHKATQRFFEPEPMWSKIRIKAQNFICIYSDDDKVVSPNRTRRLSDKLSARLVLFPGRGHFLGSRGMSTFPELLELVEA